MDSKAHIHVISKANIKHHTVVPLSEAVLSPLQDGHVRVRSAIISLANNNWSYALLGTLRNWWDAYPVPAALPAPYNDQAAYGICPAWGYGKVIESKVSGIDFGTLIWGFWPSSDLPVDLKLVPADAAGHWIEIGEGRKKLMNLYQRYVVEDPKARLGSLDRAKIEEMAWKAAFIVWEAGYLLSEAVFGSPPIHPAADGKWDEHDADLSRAVVINLSSSGKTARSFTNTLINRSSPNANPLGLLAITSAQTDTLIPKASFPTATSTYEAMTDSKTLSWISHRKPSKIVLVDFGGRGDSLHRLLRALEDNFSNIDVIIIGVGGSVSLGTPQELGEWAQKNMSLANRVQMNTSAIKDVAMKIHGPDTYYKRVEDAWQGFMKSASVRDIRLEIGEGVAGDNGFEGGWTRLAEGSVDSNVALAYKL